MLTATSPEVFGGDVAVVARAKRGGRQFEVFEVNRTTCHAQLVEVCEVDAPVGGLAVASCSSSCVDDEPACVAVCVVCLTDAALVARTVSFPRASRAPLPLTAIPLPHAVAGAYLPAWNRFFLCVDRDNTQVLVMTDALAAPSWAPTRIERAEMTLNTSLGRTYASLAPAARTVEQLLHVQPAAAHEAAAAVADAAVVVWRASYTGLLSFSWVSIEGTDAATCKAIVHYDVSLLAADAPVAVCGPYVAVAAGPVGRVSLYDAAGVVVAVDDPSAAPAPVCGLCLYNLRPTDGADRLSLLVSTATGDYRRLTLRLARRAATEAQPLDDDGRGGLGHAYAVERVKLLPAGGRGGGSILPYSDSLVVVGGADVRGDALMLASHRDVAAQLVLCKADTSDATAHQDGGVCTRTDCAPSGAIDTLLRVHTAAITRYQPGPGGARAAPDRLLAACGASGTDGAAGVLYCVDIGHAVETDYEVGLDLGALGAHADVGAGAFALLCVAPPPAPSHTVTHGVILTSRAAGTSSLLSVATGGASVSDAVIVEQEATVAWLRLRLGSGPDVASAPAALQVTPSSVAVVAAQGITTVHKLEALLPPRPPLQGRLPVATHAAAVADALVVVATSDGRLSVLHVDTGASGHGEVRLAAAVDVGGGVSALSACALRGAGGGGGMCDVCGLIAVAVWDDSVDGNGNRVVYFCASWGGGTATLERVPQPAAADMVAPSELAVVRHLLLSALPAAAAGGAGDEVRCVAVTAEGRVRVSRLTLTRGAALPLPLPLSLALSVEEARFALPVGAVTSLLPLDDAGGGFVVVGSAAAYVISPEPEGAGAAAAGGGWGCRAVAGAAASWVVAVGPFCAEPGRDVPCVWLQPATAAPDGGAEADANADAGVTLAVGRLVSTPRPCPLVMATVPGAVTHLVVAAPAADAGAAPARARCLAAWAGPAPGAAAGLGLFDALDLTCRWRTELPAPTFAGHVGVCFAGGAVCAGNRGRGAFAHVTNVTTGTSEDARGDVVVYVADEGSAAASTAAAVARAGRCELPSAALLCCAVADGPDGPDGLGGTSAAAVVVVLGTDSVLRAVDWAVAPPPTGTGAPTLRVVGEYPLAGYAAAAVADVVGGPRRRLYVAAVGGVDVLRLTGAAGSGSVTFQRLLFVSLPGTLPSLLHVARAASGRPAWTDTDPTAQEGGDGEVRVLAVDRGDPPAALRLDVHVQATTYASDASAATCTRLPLPLPLPLPVPVPRGGTTHAGSNYGDVDVDDVVCLVASAGAGAGAHGDAWLVDRFACVHALPFTAGTDAELPSA